MSKYKTILSIDGGGVRGVIPATLLQEIERKTGKRIDETFDLIAGTSTGGLLATYLAAPQRVGNRAGGTDFASFYANDRKKIFRRRRATQVSVIWCVLRLLMGSFRLHVAKKGSRDLVGHFVLKFKTKGIKQVLRKRLGNSELKDALSDLLITGYEIKCGKHYFFKTSKARCCQSHNYYLRDVARATAAAPGAFPVVSVKPVQRGCERHFVDGAVFAPDPTLCAYAEALKSGACPEEILVVSLGTGDRRFTFDPEEARDWSAVSWVLNSVTELLLDGAGDVTEYIMDKLVCGSQYFRFDIPLGKDLSCRSEHDASDDHFDKLRQKACDMVTNDSCRIEELCKELKKRKRVDAKPETPGD